MTEPDFITVADPAAQDCRAFRRGVLGNEAQGISPRPVRTLTADEASRARQTPCQECLPAGHGAP